MEIQEAFDLVVERLADGKGPSMAPDGRCMYDNGAGNHCAIGYLLKKEGIEVPKTLELCGVSGLAGFAPEWMMNETIFYAKLQYIHDSPHFWNEKAFNSHGWNAMKLHASNYKLNFKQPE